MTRYYLHFFYESQPIPRPGYYTFKTADNPHEALQLYLDRVNSRVRVESYSLQEGSIVFIKPEQPNSTAYMARIIKDSTGAFAVQKL